MKKILSCIKIKCFKYIRYMATVSVLMIISLSQASCSNKTESPTQTASSSQANMSDTDLPEKKDVFLIDTDNAGDDGTDTLQVSDMSVKKKVPEQSFADVDETVYITADSVNIRKGASTSAPILKKADKGAKFQRTGKNSEWSRIIVDGETAFVVTRYLTEEALQTTEGSKDQGGSSAQYSSGAQIKLDPSWKYAGNSKINSGYAVLYKAENNRKDITVCVNAGHGTKGGSSVKTLCHPDGTAKVTGGTTAEGAVKAVAVSTGMTFNDGTSEAAVTLKMAKALKTELLSRGYDVLMIRESDDVQLDNIARTVIANNTSSCHIALHWDSTAGDKGAFYMGVPDVASYRQMEPVASTWEKHEALGKSLIQGLKNTGTRIFGDGRLPMDLTQTSYSTIASIDIELGDKASDHSDATINTLAKGLADGVGIYFGK